MVFMKTEKNPSTALVPCPVVLLSVSGTVRPNIITLSWAANVCSKPPSLAVGIRPERYSHYLVKDAGDFVANIPSENLLNAAKFCGTKSGKNHDKFKECQLTALPSTRISSPMIDECPINIECRVSQIVDVGVHDLFIGEIVAVHIDDEIVDKNGRLNIEKGRFFTYLPPVGEYWNLGSKME